MSYLRIALPTPLRRLFDYLPPQDMDAFSLVPGVRVRVPFQSRMLTGILVEVVEETKIPTDKLKRAEAVLDQSPIFTLDVYELCEWAANYYHYSFGEVLSAALPAVLRRGKPADCKKKLPPACEERQQPLTLNDTQQKALNEILASSNQFKTFLIDGVTGSGKTEVYLQAIHAMLGLEKQVLVLVPEISLTPQTIARFRVRFPVSIAVLHSSLSDGERLAAWLAAKAGEAKIVIGTRSAIFTSFKRLGLIIVDEEHDASFKQQDRFRYHARDLAVLRANKNNIPVVLGSATPSLESLLNVKRGRYQLLELPHRAGGASMPSFSVIDMRRQKSSDGLSPALLNAMREQLQAGNQVMLFLNRRGFAPALFCAQCNWIAGCKRCDARMVYHRAQHELRCHHCDARTKMPKACQQCGDTHIEPVGFGTQRIEEILQTHFPDTPVIRVDRDSVKGKEALDSLLDKIHVQQPAILLGTQMLAKGHHFPQVTFVGIIDADNGLFSADYRAAEQMGQLLMQVAGRAGRAEKTGTVMIQTRCPEHPHLQKLICEGYAVFAQELLAERAQFVLPPYTFASIFRAEAYSDKTAKSFLDNVREISHSFSGAVTVLGPLPALMAKKKGMHCQHLIFKSDKRAVLQRFLSKLLQKLDDFHGAKSVKWILDVDPIEG